jgi:hypothetical protein
MIPTPRTAIIDTANPTTMYATQGELTINS